MKKYEGSLEGYKIINCQQAMMSLNNSNNSNIIVAKLDRKQEGGNKSDCYIISSMKELQEAMLMKQRGLAYKGLTFYAK